MTRSPQPPWPRFPCEVEADPLGRFGGLPVEDFRRQSFSQSAGLASPPRAGEVPVGAAAWQGPFHLPGRAGLHPVEDRAALRCGDPGGFRASKVSLNRSLGDLLAAVPPRGFPIGAPVHPWASVSWRPHRKTSCRFLKNAEDFFMPFCS